MSWYLQKLGGLRALWLPCLAVYAWDFAMGHCRPAHGPYALLTARRPGKHPWAFPIFMSRIPESQAADAGFDVSGCFQRG